MILIPNPSEKYLKLRSKICQRQFAQLDAIQAKIKLTPVDIKERLEEHAE